MGLPPWPLPTLVALPKHNVRLKHGIYRVCHATVRTKYFVYLLLLVVYSMSVMRPCDRNISSTHAHVPVVVPVYRIVARNQYMRSRAYVNNILVLRRLERTGLNHLDTRHSEYKVIVREKYSFTVERNYLLLKISISIYITYDNSEFSNDVHSFRTKNTVRPSTSF